MAGSNNKRQGQASANHYVFKSIIPSACNKCRNKKLAIWHQLQISFLDEHKHNPNLAYLQYQMYQNVHDTLVLGNLSNQKISGCIEQ